jgi:hypothetical protein
VKLNLAICIILASLALVAATATSASSTAGYTCKYRFTGASVVIDGYDNNRAFCRAFNKGAKAQRFYGPTRGQLVCRFESRLFDLRITVYARSRDIGSLYCLMMKSAAGRQFVRTR